MHDQEFISSMGEFAINTIEHVIGQAIIHSLAYNMGRDNPVRPVPADQLRAAFVYVMAMKRELPFTALPIPGICLAVLTLTHLKGHIGRGNVAVSIQNIDEQPVFTGVLRSAQAEYR
jgi:hypothetical protein